MHAYLKKMFRIVARLKGKSVKTCLAEAMIEYIKPYTERPRGNSITVNSRRGYYLDGLYDKEVYGKDDPEFEIVKTPCYILGYHTIHGDLYCRIYIGGSLRKVPARYVELYQHNEWWDEDDREQGENDNS